MSRRSADPRMGACDVRTRPRPATGPIAVFDSGVGGLTVLHELLVRLPHEDFLYLGDTARFPYGERSRTRSSSAFSLRDRRAAAAPAAPSCSSSPATRRPRAALPALRARMMQTTLGVDVLGVIAPEAGQAVGATHNGRIGLLATPATVASGAYERADRGRRPARRR